jgi:hypothetical protein
VIGLTGHFLLEFEDGAQPVWCRPVIGKEQTDGFGVLKSNFDATYVMVHDDFF